MNTLKEKEIGKVPLVLVSEGSHSPDAYISSVIVKTIRSTNSAKIAFKGISVFSKEVQQHIEDTIAPIVNDIVDALGTNDLCYEISIANLPVASVDNNHIRIEGFSADLPVFIAMLSAALELPVSQSILSTGHIASCSGEIISVKSLALKLHAAIQNESIQKFIYPKHEAESTFKQDSTESHNLRRILTDAGTSIKMSMVSDIDDLTKEVFTSFDIVISSLTKNYFEYKECDVTHSNAISSIVEHLTSNNPQRFWLEIQKQLMKKQNNYVSDLLGEYCRYCTRNQIYPSGAGKRLLSIVCTVPVHMRRMNDFYPLCDSGLCIRMAQYANPEDYNDVAILLNTIAGLCNTELPMCSTQYSSTTEQDSNSAFDEVIRSLNQRGLAEKIDIPVDSARASFILEKSTISSYEQFLDIVTAFMIHLLCHLDQMDLNSIDHKTCRNDALELLDKAYKPQDGFRTAYLRATEGIESGIRGVIDKMADQYKYEQKRKYANMIFKDSLNVMSWKEKVDFMRSALERIGHLLPQDIRDQPPERFAGDFEVITKAVIESLDKIRNVFAGF